MLKVFYYFIERSCKILAVILVFIWNLSFNKKYYTFFKKVYLVIPFPGFIAECKIFESTKQYFKFDILDMLL